MALLHWFCRHYADNLDGCGLSLESKVRRAYYALVRRGLEGIKSYNAQGHNPRLGNLYSGCDSDCNHDNNNDGDFDCMANLLVMITIVIVKVTLTLRMFVTKTMTIAVAITSTVTMTTSETMIMPRP